MKLSKSLRIKVVLVIAPFFSGCGTELDLDSPTATELCVEAHMAARASENHLEGRTKLFNAKGERIPRPRQSEAVSAAAAARAKANYYLLCLKASAGK
jgi:hypothetical protein